MHNWEDGFLSIPYGTGNLLNVDVRFGPFTCVAGPNGVGKSNLFDALHFLHLLTKNQVMEAVQKIRDASGRSAEPSAPPS